MDASEADKAAIMAVLRAETDAWLRRDFEALSRHWLQSPQTRRLTAMTSLGVQVDEGWDAIGAFLRSMMQRYPQTFEIEDHLRWKNVNIVVGGDMAWVSYDQVGNDADDGFEMPGVQHELKIFHRTDGTWKIACLVIMQRTVEHVASPLIEVDPDARILWMNRQARERIGDHPGLVVAAGRLRARRRDRDPALREAVRWAFHELKAHVPPRLAAGQARAVPLGEGDAGAPLFCWVLLEDGKALVSFDDTQRLAHRIDLAAQIYGLSPAQARLARLIVDGRDLAAAAEILGVSANTLRTQLQRMFDKTGVRGQAALTRALLTADVPTK